MNTEQKPNSNMLVCYAWIVLLQIGEGKQTLFGKDDCEGLVEIYSENFYEAILFPSEQEAKNWIEICENEIMEIGIDFGNIRIMPLKSEIALSDNIYKKIVDDMPIDMKPKNYENDQQISLFS